MLATKFWRLFGLSLLISAGGAAAAAAQDYVNPGTAKLNLKLTITQGCRLNTEDTPATIVFEQVTLLDNPKTLPGNFTITCTAGWGGSKKLKVTLDKGQFPGDTIANRKLHFATDSASTLDFQVYHKDGTTIWGDGTEGSQPIQVDLANNGTNWTGTGEYVVTLLKQSLAGKYAGTYTNTLQMTIDLSSE